MGELIVLDTYRFDGDELELVTIEGQGWVSLPSLLRPFGKRPDNVKGLLDGWARTRVEVLPSRKGEPGNPSVSLIHVDDAPLLVARLEQRGMSPEMKAKHSRYLKHCSGALADFFFGKKRAARLPPSVEALLLEEPGKWRRAWHMRLQAAVCRLNKKPVQPNPRWMGRFIRECYRTFWGEDVYAEIKKRNPHPSKGHNHHQMVCEELRKKLENDIEVAVAFAETCRTEREFWERMRAFFWKEPLQLWLGEAS